MPEHVELACCGWRPAFIKRPPSAYMSGWVSTHPAVRRLYRGPAESLLREADHVRTNPKNLNPVLVVDSGQSGYNLARMRYGIVLAPEAAEDLANLKANIRGMARAAIEQHLRHQPTKV